MHHILSAVHCLTRTCRLQLLCVDLLALCMVLLIRYHWALFTWHVCDVLMCVLFSHVLSVKDDFHCKGTEYHCYLLDMSWAVFWDVLSSLVVFVLQEYHCIATLHNGANNKYEVQCWCTLIKRDRKWNMCSIKMRPSLIRLTGSFQADIFYQWSIIYYCNTDTASRYSGSICWWRRCAFLFAVSVHGTSFFLNFDGDLWDDFDQQFYAHHWL